jgi:hypothetical protein
MKTENSDLQWIRMQLTIARWRLDAMTDGNAEVACRQRERASWLCDRIRAALTRIEVCSEERAVIERELSEVRGGLESTSNARSRP